MRVVTTYLNFLMTKEGNYIGLLVILVSVLISIFIGAMIYMAVTNDDIWKALNEYNKYIVIVGFALGLYLFSIFCYNESLQGLSNAKVVSEVNCKIDKGYNIILNLGEHHIYNMNNYSCDIVDLNYYNIKISDETKQITFSIKPELMCW